MSATLQSQAIAMANTITGLCQQLAAIEDAINLVSGQYTQLQGATVLGALATCAANADGSLGAADTTPTTGHVIDTRVFPALSRAQSAYDIGAALTGLQAVAALLAGSPPTQQGQMPQILAKFIGG